MHPNEPTTSKLDDYIRNESQSQMSAEKRAAIEDNPVGKARLGFNVSNEMKVQLLQKLKDAKGVEYGKIVNCIWCNEPVLIKNSRQKLVLCPKCEPGRSEIEWFFRNAGEGKGTLSKEDKALIERRVATKRISKEGPFWPNPEAQKAAKAGWRG